MPMLLVLLAGSLVTLFTVLDSAVQGRAAQPDDRR